jgi:hypothetical protein
VGNPRQVGIKRFEVLRHFPGGTGGGGGGGGQYS